MTLNMSDDFTSRPDWIEWSNRVRQETVPKLEQSKAAMILFSGTYEPKQAIEIGYAVLLNKPIIVVHMPQTAPPWKLKTIANYVVEADTSTDEGKQEFQRKISHILRGL